MGFKSATPTFIAAVPCSVPADGGEAWDLLPSLRVAFQIDIHLFLGGGVVVFCCFLLRIICITVVAAKNVCRFGIPLSEFVQ